MKRELFGAHHELERLHWWFRARRHAIVTLGSLIVPRGAKIVDVGCGTGADIAAFPADYERLGIDISAEAIAIAREAYPGVAFSVGEAPAVEARTVAEAELILLCDVLEHVEDDRGFLGNLVAAMRPGAHLLMTVPADPRLWSPHDVAYDHYRRYTRETLRSTWSSRLVDVRLFAPFNRRLYPLARLVRAVSARRGHGSGVESTDLALPVFPLNALLEAIFRAETPRLVKAFQAGPRELPGHGISYIVVLRRTDEETPSAGPGVEAALA